MAVANCTRYWVEDCGQRRQQYRPQALGSRAQGRVHRSDALLPEPVEGVDQDGPMLDVDRREDGSPSSPLRISPADNAAKGGISPQHPGPGLPVERALGRPLDTLAHDFGEEVDLLFVDHVRGHEITHIAQGS